MIVSSNTQIGSTRAGNGTGKWRGVVARYRRLYNPGDNDGARPSVPHPGDILYWVACVGAVCALLFVATK